MSGRSICLCALILLAAAGCRSQPYVNAHIESVNAEYRELEDYVYCLEDENAKLAQELDAVKRGAVAPGAVGSPSGSPGGGTFRRRPAGGSATPQSQPNPATEVPMIEVPGGGSPTPPPATRSENQPPTAGDLQVAAAAAEPQAAASAPTDAKVTHLVLNPLLTGGADFDGQPGDDGLAVVLEPRNGADQYVPQAGPVSVVVLDPARQGDAARVARWDFDLSAARQKLASASPARGLKFELPWPAAPPANSHLKVFVRYETPDGRRLTTDREVYLASTNETSPGWTPRTGASASAAEQVASLPAPPGARNAAEGVPSSAPAAEEPARLPPAIAPGAPLVPPAALSAGAPPVAARPVWLPNR